MTSSLRRKFFYQNFFVLNSIPSLIWAASYKTLTEEPHDLMVAWVSVGNISWCGIFVHAQLIKKIQILCCKYWSGVWQDTVNTLEIVKMKHLKALKFLHIFCCCFQRNQFCDKIDWHNIDTINTSDGKYSRKLQDCNHLHLVEHNLQDYYCILLISSRWDRKVSIKNSYFHCQHTLEQYSILYHSPVTSNDLLSVLSHQVQWLDGENMWMLLWVLVLSRKKVSEMEYSIPLTIFQPIGESIDYLLSYICCKDQFDNINLNQNILS